MEQRDYFMRQVELFWQVLGKLLVKILEMKNSNEIVETANKTFCHELGLNSNELVNITIENLLKNEKINNANLEKIADILYFIFENSDTKEKTLLAKKCLEIYEYLNISEKTYSLERQQKISKLLLFVQ